MGTTAWATVSCLGYLFASAPISLQFSPMQTPPAVSRSASPRDVSTDSLRSPLLLRGHDVMITVAADGRADPVSDSALSAGADGSSPLTELLPDGAYCSAIRQARGQNVLRPAHVDARRSAGAGDENAGARWAGTGGGHLLRALPAAMVPESASLLLLSPAVVLLRLIRHPAALRS